MADTVKLKVVGNSLVAGASKGDVIELDPELYNIQALIDGGHVEPVKTPKRDDK